MSLITRTAEIGKKHGTKVTAGGSLVIALASMCFGEWHDWQAVKRDEAATRDRLQIEHRLTYCEAAVELKLGRNWTNFVQGKAEERINAMAAKR